VGEDQVAHVELTREVARRFNHLYGREPGYEALAEEAIQKLSKKNSKLYRELRQAYLEQGDKQALVTARALLERQKNMTLGSRERLFGYLEGGGRLILPEPEALLTHAPKMPGLDGRKMSKSYANTISLREDPAAVEQKLKTMPTDPARVRRSDPGNPEKCPVWEFHKVYSNDKTRQWVDQGCRSAGIGCIECKRPVIDAVLAELKPIQERVAELTRDPLTVRNIVEDGCKHARDVAEETLVEVRNAMGLGYSS
jgi:tryptophanyl-tRNA synthetase